MDIHGKMSWTLGPNLRRKTESCPCIRFLCIPPPPPPPPPCALLPYLRACHAPFFIVGIILFDCLRIFFLIVFLICLQVFTYVYFRFGAVVIGIFICTVVLKVDVLILWMCAYFWKEQRLCISMRIISTVSVSSNTIAVCIRHIFKLADSHQLQKLDLQILFAVNIVRLYWLKNVACPWQFENLSQVEEPLYFHGAFLHT